MPSAFSSRLFRLLRSGLAGGAATLVDLAVLSLLVSVVGLPPSAASAPALLAGGLANFFANRHFAFRAHEGSLLRQLALYVVVESGALALNGLLFEIALRLTPGAPSMYVALRLVTSHLVFLAYSYPLWHRVFSVGPRIA